MEFSRVMVSQAQRHCSQDLCSHHLVRAAQGEWVPLPLGTGTTAPPVTQETQCRKFHPGCSARPLLSFFWNGQLHGLLLPEVVPCWSEIFMIMSDGWNLTTLRDGCTAELWKLQPQAPSLARPLPRPWVSPRNGTGLGKFTEQHLWNLHNIISYELWSFKKTSLNYWW